MTYKSGEFPEPGASCENPAFAADPLTAEDVSTPIGPSDMPTTDGADPTGTEPTEAQPTEAQPTETGAP
ncbi:hypothetical protein [Blastococcus brunescens]|uniref:Uncharacterized protein n=1 Tax=Blastococcus brunescens TaxID=1564165 RepID=A0ABZ1BAW7_9ACTN|nr:hypothetical protein [Blastococcus sp. BMG 8361]WRL67298.1 hypothetical protein U6N30_22740 [Blastococcus sp. BMG 8361]